MFLDALVTGEFCMGHFCIFTHFRVTHLELLLSSSVGQVANKDLLAVRYWWSPFLFTSEAICVIWRKHEKWQYHVSITAAPDTKVTRYITSFFSHTKYSWPLTSCKKVLYWHCVACCWKWIFNKFLPSSEWSSPLGLYGRSLGGPRPCVFLGLRWLKPPLAWDCGGPLLMPGVVEVRGVVSVRFWRQG